MIVPLYETARGRLMRSTVGARVEPVKAGASLSIRDGHFGAARSIETWPLHVQKFGSVEAKKGGVRKGFGLGLYMVKLVAEGHGGGVEVLDRDGGGALFRRVLHE